MYSIVRQGDGRTFALRRADGFLFSGVVLPGPLAEAVPGSLVAAQLAIVRGKTFVNGPARLLVDGEAACWHGPTLWNAIEQEEQGHARRTTFTTPFGKSLSLYDDLYTRPNDPAEAHLADCGIYPDEPTILDFLHLVKPAG